MEQFHSVVIVGAGMAGLYAANCLKGSVQDLIVLEAQSRVGGRVKQVSGVAPWAIDVGPEFIHGSKSILASLVQSMGFECTEKEWPDWWYFGKEKKLVQDSRVDGEVEQVHGLFDDIGDEAPPPPGEDISLAEWMRRRGATPRMLAIADACYANDFGCSLRQLGLRETIEENRRWDSGETYLLMDRSLVHVAARLAENLPLRLSWPVMRIEHGPEGARLHGPGGAVIRCRHVIVTVPLTVLQAGGLAFSPSLPSVKQAALSRIRMGSAVKILVSFSCAFWPQDMYDVVCCDCFVPEFWICDAPPAGHPDALPAATAGHAPATHPPAAQHAVTGFAAGERAVEIGAMDPDEAIRVFLRQLDEIFARGDDVAPASSAFVYGQVVDWAAEPYIRGAYSYPSLGAELGDRDALAAPLGSTVFFAGEATHPAINPCVQAALETGSRAAAQVQAAMAPPASKL